MFVSRCDDRASVFCASCAEWIAGALNRLISVFQSGLVRFEPDRGL